MKSGIASEVSSLSHSGRSVCLAVVLVGDDPASEVYVRNKERDCAAVGIESRTLRMSADATTEQLVFEIERLNRDEAVSGIIVQLPLPRGIDKNRVIDAIDPKKDVDCFTPQNIGLLFAGRGLMCPCTPAAVLRILDEYGIDAEGKCCVIIGRSDIVGKPLSLMLTARSATVTLCHSKTRNLQEITKAADILIAAVGKPRFVTAPMVREGAVVIDVGINPTDDGLVGDVDYAAVFDKCLAITPVPGGVGVVTRAMLLNNAVIAAKNS